MADFYQLTPEQQGERLQALAIEILPRWGVSPSKLELIKMRENAVFRVDTAGGDRYALRIHRAGYHSDAALRSELQWMQALHEAGVEVPEILPLDDGRLFCAAGSAEVGEARQIDLWQWIDGRQLGSVETGLDGDDAAAQETYRMLGRLAARVHNQATRWEPPPGFIRHAWDVEGLAGERPLWGRFWELAALTEPQRRLMEKARAALFADLSAYGKTPATYSLIHADFTPENIMVDGPRVRLIDFDDAGFGWHLFELATALYFIQAEPFYDTAFEALIDGYRSERSLSDADLERLPLFMLARGTTYLGWVHTRRETETARELTPALVEMVCASAQAYLTP